MKILLVETTPINKKGLPYILKSEFEKLGHVVEYFNSRLAYMHKFQISKQLLNQYLLLKAKRMKPDLVFVVKGESILPNIIDKIKATGIKTAVWNPDEPFGAIMPFNRLSNIREYDYYFSFSINYLDKIKRLRKKNTFHVPFGVYPEIHKEESPLNKREYKYDISLLGTAYKNRIDLLSDVNSYNLALVGPKWKTVKDSYLSSRVVADYLAGNQMNGFFNSSKINLNIYLEHPYVMVPSHRTFEIPATNSFQIATYFDDMKNYFIPDKEIVLFRDKNELLSKIDYYLKNEKERNKITQAGHKRVMKDHLISNRVREMLRLMEEN
jgi:spore maturation protein CgeB